MTIFLNYNLSSVVGQVGINLSTGTVGSSWGSISWTQPSYIPMSYPIEGYELGVYSTEECISYFNRSIISHVTLMNVTSETHQYKITNLLPNTCYLFIIRAYAVYGHGPWASSGFRTMNNTENQCPAVDRNDTSSYSSPGL